jgi:hypothetical protein
MVVGKLTWFPLPFGLVVVGVDFFAVREVNGRLPTAPVEANEHVVPQAIAAFIPFAQGRIAWLGAFFIVAALLFGLVELGLRRRPSGLMLGAGVLSGAYLAAMPVVYVLNPVTGYDQDFPDSPGYATMPFDMGPLAPPWYLPLLGCTLAAAAIAQLFALRGIVRRDAHLPPSPWNTWLLLLPSAFLLVFAAANLVSDRIARATAPPASFREADFALEVMWRGFAFAAVPAAALALCGVLQRRYGLGPHSLLVVGGLTVVYVLTLPIAAGAGLAMYSDEQHGFTEHLPRWREAVTVGILGASALVQLAAVPLLARRGKPPATGAESGG